MKKTLHLKIVTPERTVYDANVESLSARTSAGTITVLPDHVPLITELAIGELSVTKENQRIRLANAGGVLEVRDNKVVILGDGTEHAAEIDLEEARAAYKRAKEMIKNKEDILDVDYIRFRSMLDKNLNRITIAEGL